MAGQIDKLVTSLRRETEDLFYHGYENYMKVAFPEDELRPISCKPLTRDRENPAHIELNDPLGNYSLTLIDSLSTLAILSSTPSDSKRNKAFRLFQDGVRDFIRQYGDGTVGSSGEGLRAAGFDLDSKVQVFETAIRGLGGLLSAHLFAVGDLPIRGYNPLEKQVNYAKAWDKATYTGAVKGIKWANGFEYDGQLLRLAYDLGNRLLPAFWTSTGIPYPRVNLRHGIPFYANSPLNVDPENGQCGLEPGPAEITETCSAGAGSLVLEFTVLSRLTGDSRFEDLAKRAFWEVWNRRSDLSLIGAGIDAETGIWVNSWTGIGAGIDSFFEYAFKSHVLLSRDAPMVNESVTYEEDPRILFDQSTTGEETSTSFLDAWDEAHAAIKRHIYRGPNYQHPHYIQVDLITGAAKGFWIDALSAYYPGLLTLAGHVEEAVEIHLLQTALWTRFSALPERWNLITGGIDSGLGWWVGRPEFIESTFYLYRATEDPWYLYVGEMVLRDIKRRCWTKCGWAGIQNVLTGEKVDRMESFFLGETAKYLFLLFDPGHPLNRLDAPFVFTTEGHPLIIPDDKAAGLNLRKTNLPGVPDTAVCPPKPPSVPFSISATASRGDVYHAASLARLHLMPARDNVESVLGEYAVDHPSITLSDVSSPSNYTYFPWTLPPALIPFNATSIPMRTRPTFDISFPNLPNQGQQSAPPLQRVKEGIVITFIGGLRLGMVQDMSVAYEDISSDSYRIQSINNLALGKDEKVFMSKDAGSGLLNPTDPNFNRIRDATMLDIVIDLPASASSQESTVNTTSEEKEITIETSDLTIHQREAEAEAEADESKMKAVWNAIVSQLTSLIHEKQHHQLSPSSPFPSLPSLGEATASTIKQGHSRFYLPAITSTGLGAAPLPDWPEAPSPLSTSSQSPGSSSDPSSPSVPPLQWTQIFATDTLCTHRLPDSVPRTHQVLIVKRGECSFSEKLANIPSFQPSLNSLKLVVVVSDRKGGGTGNENENENEREDPEPDLIRPYLDAHQATPAGLPRHHPIPMVMVAGGDRSYRALASAKGLGVKRRYSVYTQGVPIGNLIVV